jgi:hypothetical protein
MRKGLGGFIILLIGVLLLANTTGFLSWQVWSVLWKFWPLFIVFAGIEMLQLSQRIKALIFLVLMLAVVVFLIRSVGTRNELPVEEELNPESFMVIPT